MAMRHEMLLVTGKYPAPNDGRKRGIAFEATICVQLADKDIFTDEMKTCITNNSGAAASRVKVYQDWAEPLGLVDDKGVFNFQFVQRPAKTVVNTKIAESFQVYLERTDSDRVLDKDTVRYKFSHPFGEHKTLAKINLDGECNPDPETYPLTLTIKRQPKTREDCHCSEVVGSKNNRTKLEWTFV